MGRWVATDAVDCDIGGGLSFDIEILEAFKHFETVFVLRGKLGNFLGSLY